MNIIQRSELTESWQKDIMVKESHHEHRIEIVNDRPKWVSNLDVCKMVDVIGLNELVALLRYSGYTKNSEVYRKLYRDIGYSLYGYWEVFYFDMNNESKPQ